MASRGICSGVDLQEAADSIFTGRTLTAEQSLEAGLVNRAVPAASLPEETCALAQEIADNAPSKAAFNAAGR